MHYFTPNAMIYTALALLCAGQAALANPTISRRWNPAGYDTSAPEALGPDNADCQRKTYSLDISSNNYVFTNVESNANQTYLTYLTQEFVSSLPSDSNFTERFLNGGETRELSNTYDISGLVLYFLGSLAVETYQCGYAVFSVRQRTAMESRPRLFSFLFMACAYYYPLSSKGEILIPLLAVDLIRKSSISSRQIPLFNALNRADPTITSKAKASTKTTATCALQPTMAIPPSATIGSEQVSVLIPQMRTSQHPHSNQGNSD